MHLRSPVHTHGGARGANSPCWLPSQACKGCEHCTIGGLFFAYSSPVSLNTWSIANFYTEQRGVLVPSLLGQWILLYKWLVASIKSVSIKTWPKIGSLCTQGKRVPWSNSDNSWRMDYIVCKKRATAAHLHFSVNSCMVNARSFCTCSTKGVCCSVKFILQVNGSS